MKNLYKQQNFKWFLVIQIAWLATILLIGAWWGNLVIKQARVIQILEEKVGIFSENYEKTSRMVTYELSAFVILLLLVTSFIIWLYWRDQKRVRALSAFFASVTHELKTPLTSIRLQSEALAGVLPENNKLLARLLEDAQRLENQVERTLELARLEGGGRIYLKLIRLRGMVEKISKQWNYDKRLSVDFKEVDSEAEVLADPTGLQIILKNIIENSLRHSKSEKVIVTIKTVNNAHTVHLVIVDNNEGVFERDILPKKLGKLFEKGSQSQGAGVGLYLVSNLMKKMEGSAVFFPAPTNAQGFEVQLVFQKPLHAESES